MAERIDGRTWVMRGVFITLAMGLIVVQLVPHDMQPASWAGPDLLLAVTLVWVARRPAVLPVTVIALVFLLADLFFMRPPGLWAALVVVLAEMIRRRNSEFRSMPFLAEWGTIAFGVVAINVAYRLVLFVVALPQPPFGLTVMGMVATILIYPLVALIAYALFGIRRAAPGETGNRGQLI